MARIEGHSSIAHLQMQVRSGGTPRATRQGYQLPCLDFLILFYKKFGAMGVKSLQSVQMTHHNQIAIGSVTLGYTHISVKQAIN